MAGVLVPKVIKNFNLTVQNVGYAGRVEECRLPDLKIRGEEHRAGGMDMPIMIDLGMDRPEFGFTLSEHDPNVLQLLGLTSQNAVSLLFQAAQVDDVNVIPYKITVRGMITDQRLGSVKNGTMARMENTVSCRYYKLEIDGNLIHELDADNMIRNMGNQDQMLAIRAAIGM